MANPIGSITRAATRSPNEPLNILTFPTHERYQSGLAKINAIFYLIRTPNVKDWNGAYAKLPENHILLNPKHGNYQIPTEVDFDLILSQNKFGQFQICRNLSKELHLPLVSLEHTLPIESWPKAKVEEAHFMRGDLNVFISEYSRDKWGWSPKEAEVIHHGIDTDTFSANSNIIKKPHILSVVNDWINRDWCCGFRLWQKITNGMPVLPVGNTTGLSKPAKDLSHLVSLYNEAQIFVNTSLISPVPTSLLEAMSCGCAVVTSATCMIPEIVENGVNGFISNDPAELAGYCHKLLSDAELCRKLGVAARETIKNKFSMGVFVNKWKDVFERASKVVYKGNKWVS